VRIVWAGGSYWIEVVQRCSVVSRTLHREMVASGNILATCLPGSSACLGAGWVVGGQGLTKT
jgi:hypothetical protein